MKRASFASFDCSIARTLDVVGDPWTLLIVRDAFFGVRRFDDFHNSLGIPRSTLSTRLTALVDNEVLERRGYKEHPPRHEYVLTDKGRSLGPVLIALLQWGDEWSGAEEPPVTLIDNDTGEPITPVFIDESSGRPLGELRIDRRRRQFAGDC